MNKTFGSICMIAGTAIGAGMIALPMTLAKLGVLGSLALMIATWLVVYYSALIGCELTVRVKNSLSLSEIAKQLSGSGAASVALGCVMILSYALIAAYLYGGSSITLSICTALWDSAPDQERLIQLYAVVITIILVLGITWVDYLNRLMFFALIGLLLVTIIGLGVTADLSTIPMLTDQTAKVSTWSVAIPVIFTSFGFQMMIPTMSGYLARNQKAMKRAFYWGSLIPVVIYLAWTLSTLGTITTHNMSLFKQILTEDVDVGAFVNMLSQSASWRHLQLFVWGVSFFAIITSAFGVALGLIDLWYGLLCSFKVKERFLKILTAILTIVPAYIIAILTPGAFIKALGFAGMILVIIAIVLPIYLLFKSDARADYTAFNITQHKGLRVLVLGLALGLIGCEIGNLFNFF
ncbi:MAG: hypothetical protein KF798_02625 [Candidatus Paracaedibacteraceae bacterium]|nr:hypothetical protein [Candidatus Paracaedibacteraceae bacterium]